MCQEGGGFHSSQPLGPSGPEGEVLRSISIGVLRRAGTCGGH